MDADILIGPPLDDGLYLVGELLLCCCVGFLFIYALEKFFDHLTQSLPHHQLVLTDRLLSQAFFDEDDDALQPAPASKEGGPHRTPMSSLRFTTQDKHPPPLENKLKDNNKVPLKHTKAKHRPNNNDIGNNDRAQQQQNVLKNNKGVQKIEPNRNIDPNILYDKDVGNENSELDDSGLSDSFRRDNTFVVTDWRSTFNGIKRFPETQDSFQDKHFEDFDDLAREEEDEGIKDYSTMTAEEELRQRKAMTLAKSNARHVLSAWKDHQDAQRDTQARVADFLEKKPGNSKDVKRVLPKRRDQRSYIEGRGQEVVTKTGEKISFSWMGQENGTKNEKVTFEGGKQDEKKIAGRGPAAIEKLHHLKMIKENSKELAISTKSAPLAKQPKIVASHADSPRGQTAKTPKEEDSQYSPSPLSRDFSSSREAFTATASKENSNLSVLSGSLQLNPNDHKRQMSPRRIVAPRNVDVQDIIVPHPPKPSESSPVDMKPTLKRNGKLDSSKDSKQTDSSGEKSVSRIEKPKIFKPPAKAVKTSSLGLSVGGNRSNLVSHNSNSNSSEKKSDVSHVKWTLPEVAKPNLAKGQASSNVNKQKESQSTGTKAIGDDHEVKNQDMCNGGKQNKVTYPPIHSRKSEKQITSKLVNISLVDDGGNTENHNKNSVKNTILEKRTHTHLASQNKEIPEEDSDINSIQPENKNTKARIKVKKETGGWNGSVIHHGDGQNLIKKKTQNLSRNKISCVNSNPIPKPSGFNSNHKLNANQKVKDKKTVGLNDHGIVKENNKDILDSESVTPKTPETDRVLAALVTQTDAIRKQTKLPGKPDTKSKTLQKSSSQSGQQQQPPSQLPQTDKSKHLQTKNQQQKEQQQRNLQESLLVHYQQEEKRKQRLQEHKLQQQQKVSHSLNSRNERKLSKSNADSPQQTEDIHHGYVPSVVNGVSEKVDQLELDIHAEGDDCLDENTVTPDKVVPDSEVMDLEDSACSYQLSKLSNPHPGKLETNRSWSISPNDRMDTESHLSRVVSTTFKSEVMPGSYRSGMVSALDENDTQPSPRKSEIVSTAGALPQMSINPILEALTRKGDDPRHPSKEQSSGHSVNTSSKIGKPRVSVSEFGRDSRNKEIYPSSRSISGESKPPSHRTGSQPLTNTNVMIFNGGELKNASSYWQSTFGGQNGLGGQLSFKGQNGFGGYNYSNYGGHCDSDDSWSLHWGEDDAIQFIEGEQDFYKVFGYNEETTALLKATKVHTVGDINANTVHNGNDHVNGVNGELSGSNIHIVSNNKERNNSHKYRDQLTSSDTKRYGMRNVNKPSVNKIAPLFRNHKTEHNKGDNSSMDIVKMQGKQIISFQAPGVPKTSYNASQNRGLSSERFQSDTGVKTGSLNDVTHVIRGVPIADKLPTNKMAAPAVRQNHLTRRNLSENDVHQRTHAPQNIIPPVLTRPVKVGQGLKTTKNHQNGTEPLHFTYHGSYKNSLSNNKQSLLKTQPVPFKDPTHHPTSNSVPTTNNTQQTTHYTPGPASDSKTRSQAATKLQRVLEYEEEKGGPTSLGPVLPVGKSRKDRKPFIYERKPFIYDFTTQISKT